jgi:hypothetical protein
LIWLMVHCARTTLVLVLHGKSLFRWHVLVCMCVCVCVALDLLLGGSFLFFWFCVCFFLVGWGKGKEGKERKKLQTECEGKVCHRFCGCLFSVACMPQKDKSTRSNTHRRGNLSSLLMDATTKVGVGFASQRQKQGSRSLACFSLSLSLALDSLWSPSRPWNEE